MIYGSVCSGIEAATVAWHSLGWRPAFFSEIDPFARAVLSHHYPEVPLHGDFTTIQSGQYSTIDLLVGGTPCQSFSVAGLRGGLGDDRGNLAIEYFQLAQRLRPRWLVWENVPGVLSSGRGRDFGAIVGAMEECGYGWAYRVIDAQYFGVPQRRRRVYVVGYLGDWRRAATVLFEPKSLQWDSPPRRQAGKNVAPTISARPTGGGGLGTDFDLDGGLIASTLRARDHSRGVDSDCTDTLIPAVYAIQERAVSENMENGPQGKGYQPDIAYTLEARNKVQSVAFGGNNQSGPIDIATACNAHGGPHGRLDFESETFVAGAFGVRRLMPIECERLMGFPDNYTRIPIKVLKSKPTTTHFAKYRDLYEQNHDGTWTQFAADGPRYKALGNSFAVPVVRWIGERIAMVDAG